MRDGDTVHALIKGTAINNDGSLKIGYTAPSAQGQAAAISEALALSGVSADSISYVEAHGTGTGDSGDPIEVAALSKAYRQETERVGYCAIGSVKSNIGHPDAAAGVAGIIKTVLALKHRQLPPSLHFKQPNPQDRLCPQPVLCQSLITGLAARGTPLPCRGQPWFGWHQCPSHFRRSTRPASHNQPTPCQPGCCFRTQRSRTCPGEHQSGSGLSQQPDGTLADVAYTLQVGRRHFPYRQAVVA